MVFEKKIFWVHWMGRMVPERTMDELIRNVIRRTPNVKGIAIKVADGNYWQGRYDSNNDMVVNGPEDILRWAKALARNGLQTYLWAVIRADDIEEESRILGLACRVRGIRAMIFDVEAGPAYFGGKTATDARRLINRVRNAAPNDLHFALNFDARGNHPRDIHIEEWLPHMDSLHPMVYHWHFSEGTRGPTQYIDEAFRVCNAYNKPVVPMLQAYPDPATNTNPPEQDTYEAGIYSFQKGAMGISYFRLGSETEADRRAIARIDPNSISTVDREFETQPTRDFIVATAVLNVRSEPEVDPRTLIAGAQLSLGARIEVLSNSRQENENFVWWRHRAGWSAERRIDGREVYMVETEDDLPAPAFIFERSPVDLDQLKWFYYFGNTVFAFRYGREHGYPNYSQGLHGGLDYGHPGGIPIFAGVYGTFDYSGSGRAFAPNRVDILVGEHRIIYGHVSQPIRMAQGTRVTPDTVVGMMDFGAKHMHLEIRLRDAYLLNPLLFLPRVQVDTILSEHPPVDDYAFYSSERWTKWLTPFDQPTLVLGGPVIGPTA